MSYTEDSWPLAKPSIEEFRSDPIKYIREHPDKFDVPFQVYPDSLIWSNVINPNMIELINKLTGLNITVNQKYHSWEETLDDILACRPTTYEQFYSNYPLINEQLKYADYEELGSYKDTVYWTEVTQVYHIPKWFYEKHNLWKEFDIGQRVAWTLMTILEEWLTNYKRSRKTKRAI